MKTKRATHPSESAFNTLLREYKKRATKTKIVFNIPVGKFKELTQLNCYYCGLPPERSVVKGQGKNGTKFNGDYIYNGIDRVDNSKGYIISNCVPCCTICNRAKNNLPQSVFLEWIEKLKSN